MLVLTHKVGHDIFIEAGGQVVKLTIMRADRGQARIAYDAPTSVSIVRGNAKVKEQKDA